jgi:hypothetical protein
MSTLYSSQSLSASGGVSLSPTLATLSASLICLHVKVTNGSIVPTPDKRFQLVVAATPFTLSAASDAPGKLEPSYVLTCLPSNAASGVAYYKTEPFIAEGSNLYAWVNSDALGQGVMLDATIVEIA